jgi:hypothetical protein
MSTIELNRRQFMQWGAAAGWAASQGLSTWAQAANSNPVPVPVMQTDPFLQLALMHEFEDHALQAWPLGMRLSVVLDHIERAELAQNLGADVHIQTLLHDAELTWATLSLEKEALLRLHQQGLGTNFQSHLWGAPWGHSEGRSMSLTNCSPNARAVSIQQAAGQPHRPATRQRVLLIDHGFPLTHLSESGLSYLHHASHANNRATAFTQAYSHGAQTLGLLLQTSPSQLGHGRAPLLLYELPDALLDSMPLGALWPDILDAVYWGLNSVNPGEELVILLSVVSNDGDRHSQSFVTRSAQAMQRHAKGLGVDLTWVMAAGNQHHAQQHLHYRVLPGQAAVWQWELPANNAQASYLECWHDADAGQPEIMFKAPCGQWQSSGHGVTSAWRLESNGKIQTVFRLPATCSSHSHQNMALAGAWGVCWQAPGGAADLEVSLSMTSSRQLGPYRQAKLLHHPDSTASRQPIQSLSGLIPHMPGVWVAQALDQGVSSSLVMTPKPHQLTGYSGRWSSDHDLNGVRSAGAKVDSSTLWPGLKVMSLHGHHLHRGTGTSMAVPLVARGLLSGHLGGWPGET